MKKIGIAIVAAGALIALIYLLIYLIHSLPPRAILEDAELYDIFRVEYVSENNNYIDVTTQIDLDELRHILAKYECRPAKIHFGPYNISLVDYEISGIYNHRPLHIILGDINVVYEDGSKGGHPIENSAALISEIDELVGR